MEISLREVKEDVSLFFDELYWEFLGIFARTREELAHYFAKDGCKIYDILDGNIKIGAIFVICHGNRSIVTGMAIEKLGLILTCRVRQEDKDMLSERSCTNAPSNIIIPDLLVGEQFWEIHEYSIKYKEVYKSNAIILPFNYVIETIDNESSFEEILAFDFGLFSLVDRKDFLETCRRNSDVVYVVRGNNEIKGFGMLSKPINEERLLGPVYAMDDDAGFDIVDAIFSAVVREFCTTTIVAYAPARNTRVLDGRGFFPIRNKVWTRYSSCNNYNCNCDKIIALGSLPFDVC